ncbi:MAG: hypothetical protein JXR95_02900 [Deltaproteobacteria bacterium]|nr:hypothetical protein [Deltaproteobacteria bacterium]
MSDVKNFMEKYLEKHSKSVKKFMAERTRITESYSTPEVHESVKNTMEEVNESETPKILNTEEKDGMFKVELSTGESFVLAKTTDSFLINDILAPCDCTWDEDLTGKCQICEGEGEIEGTEEVCPMCEGTGECPNCKGTGVISMASFIGEEENENFEPLTSKDALLTDIEGDEKINTLMAEFLLKMDKAFYQHFLELREIYKEYFDADAIGWPEMLFPWYEPSYMEEFTLEEDGNYYGVFELAGEDLLITLNKDRKVSMIEAPCALLEMNSALHGDEAIQCDCDESTENNEPDPECEQCHGTGIIFCPVCLGNNWIEVAPNPVKEEEFTNPQRYREAAEKFFTV